VSGDDTLTRMPKPKNDAPVAMCLVCRDRPAIRAHLLPESFVREIFHEPKADEKHMIIHPETGAKFQSNTGRFERGILCAECDGVIGRYEESAFKLIKRLRSVRVGQKLGNQSIINIGNYPFRVAVVDEFVRFACGILWKYSSTPTDESSHVEIGKCRALFEDICWRGAAIPEGVDVFIERDLFAFAAFTDPSQVYYYCSPSIGRRGYRTSHDLAWFSVGGFTIYMKLNQPGLSDFAPRKCWMRGRKACHFNVAMRSIEVNSSIHESIGMTRDDLARLNKGIHAKYDRGQLP
jgi:hypothetical protein